MQHLFKPRQHRYEPCPLFKLIASLSSQRFLQRRLIRGCQLRIDAPEHILREVGLNLIDKPSQALHCVVCGQVVAGNQHPHDHRQDERQVFVARPQYPASRALLMT